MNKMLHKFINKTKQNKKEHNKKIKVNMNNNKQKLINDCLPFKTMKIINANLPHWVMITKIGNSIIGYISVEIRISPFIFCDVHWFYYFNLFITHFDFYYVLFVCCSLEHYKQIVL